MYHRQSASLVVKRQKEKEWRLRPDACISTAVAGRNVSCLTVEIKSARGTIPKCDLLKLSYERKAMLDTMIEHNVSEPVVYGILIEGTLMLC